MKPKFLSLVLEDDPLCAEILREVVRAEGGEAVVCATVRAAEEAVERLCFDVLILDNMLPDGTGADFFRALQERGGTPRAIMLTGMPNLEGAVELTRGGLFDYLAKPVEVSEFTQRLRRVLGSLPHLDVEDALSDLVAQSVAMRDVRRLVQQAAQNRGATVLLTGETGSGKDLVARSIHRLSFPAVQPAPAFLAINCSALPGEMFEAELFGAEKGAYTGAHQVRLGLVEAASEGTLFLDEIAEVPLGLQAKLLQFLETREHRRLGSAQVRRFGGRIIAATNRVLAEEVEAGRFRADLWYRLDVFSICVPPLRERRADLSGLIEMLLVALCERYERRRPNVRPEDAAALQGYDFPGNVRELRNLLERALLRTAVESSWLEFDRGWLSGKAGARVAPKGEGVAVSETGGGGGLSPLETVERELIQRVLAEEGGVIRRAASRLGISHQTLLRRLERWRELRPPEAPR